MLSLPSRVFICPDVNAPAIAIITTASGASTWDRAAVVQLAAKRAAKSAPSTARRLAPVVTWVAITAESVESIDAIEAVVKEPIVTTMLARSAPSVPARIEVVQLAAAITDASAPSVPARAEPVVTWVAIAERTAPSVQTIPAPVVTLDAITA